MAIRPAMSGGEGARRGRKEKGWGGKGHTKYRNSWKDCIDYAKMGGTCLEKKNEGLSFYIYNPTRQAKFKEEYPRKELQAFIQAWKHGYHINAVLFGTQYLIIVTNGPSFLLFKWLFLPQ